MLVLFSSLPNIIVKLNCFKILRAWNIDNVTCFIAVLWFWNFYMTIKNCLSIVYVNYTKETLYCLCFRFIKCSFCARIDTELQCSLPCESTSVPKFTARKMFLLMSTASLVFVSMRKVFCMNPWTALSFNCFCQPYLGYP